MGRRIAGYALLAFLLYMLVTNPTGAAGTVRTVLAGSSHVATALGAFVNALGHNSSHPAAHAASLPVSPTSLGGLS